MDTIGDLLTGHPVLTLPETASALEAARAMSERKVGAVLVVDPTGDPCGIFTERDLMVRVVAKGLDPAATPVSGVMTGTLFFASADEPVEPMCREMQSRHIRHLPVVRGGRVLGLLSLRDLLRHNLKMLAEHVEHLNKYIQGE